MKKIFFVFLIFAISTVLIFSQATSGKVKMRGIVVDKATGDPLEGVKIKLFSLKAQSAHNLSPVTDAEGKWRSMYMRGGKWYLDFSKVGYAPRKIAVDYVFQGKYICYFQGNKHEVLKIEMEKIQGPALEQSII
ncbi:MAG: carboxypeptidase-like regulatory domain-containing protein, partial [Acidobacteriota bacterium]